LVRDGTVTSFDGDLEEYRTLIVGGGRPRDDKPRPGPADEALSRADQRKVNADRRASLAPLRKKINEIESLTAKLEKQIQALDVELADPALYEKNPAAAARKAKDRADAAARLAAAEEEWLELSGEYEGAMAG
ncbi:ABC transporter ATP-binding protein, partial [Rhizobium sp. TRM95111]|nr:ABC transporter ATP-binding protein [Rhizobium alarense]